MKGERLGEFEELVLLATGLLADTRGVIEIQEVLKREAGRFASLGSLYAALDRIERKGFVSSEVKDLAQQGRRKRFYHLTQKGHTALDRVRNTRERMWQSIQVARSSE